MKEQSFLVALQSKDIGLVAQLVRAPPCHGGGRRFESDRGRYGILAQLGEHLPYKQRVIGSSPIGPIYLLCRRGGTGRRPGLKIPWVEIPVPVRFRSPADILINSYLCV